ncbi:MAG: hypothetical protein RMI43_04665 [Candidatus Caldarchaeum sp.]|nr:hypothetical protein [Candidatus Caldarchaeum sp.]MCS7133676.1 hypothetical protein [Candidatus Caldarchaeum sp.]MCX8201260.1 hypothetical protein [Candidatus Caldarchaeum sp.]MDW8063444.1 hypothetical protein [Candidatus Caldarchaeum sp.]MDW8434894.1 hypothetical protein [Candidatus Caldarchaeum sp.]
MNDELSRLEREHPELFAEAYGTVKEGRVKKYVFRPGGRVRWVVVGKTRDYLVVPAAGFCTCEDFFFRVMSNEKPMCYHLLAVRLAEITEMYTVIEESMAWHDRLMEEWIFQSKV